MSIKKDYIADGKFFASLDDVQEYAQKLGYYIHSTETIRRKGMKGKKLCELRVIPSINNEFISTAGSYKQWQ